MHVNLFTVLGFVFILAIFGFIGYRWNQKRKHDKLAGKP